MGSDALRKGSWTAGGATDSAAGGPQTGVRPARKAAPARGGAVARAVRAAACAGAVGVLFACAGQEPKCRSERCDLLPLEVMTWWPNAGSSPGASLQEAAQDQHGVLVNLNPKSSKDEMMASLEQILDGTNTVEHVDAFLTHPGPDLLRWTPCGGAGRANVRRLNGPDGYGDLSARFDPRVLKGLQCCPPGAQCTSPDIYGVPLGLHQVNHIIRNKERFAKCPGKVVKDLDSLIDLLDCLHVDGLHVISVPVNEFRECALDDDACWKNQEVAGQSLQYLVESLALLVAQSNNYRARWSGRCWEQDTARAITLLGEGLEALDRVRPYLNDCAPGPCISPPIDADAALQEVGRGEAAFFVAPDWTQLTVAGLSQKADRIAFPGTSETFLFTTDAFALPSLPDASNEAGLRWVDTLLQPELQARFAAINGAHPALAAPADLPPLLPSLELQSPAIIDAREMRKRLNAWAQAKFSGPPPGMADLMDDALRTARDTGLLPVNAPDNTACGAP